MLTRRPDQGRKRGQAERRDKLAWSRGWKSRDPSPPSAPERPGAISKFLSLTCRCRALSRPIDSLSLHLFSVVQLLSVLSQL
jgi:hypothetical protein